MGKALIIGCGGVASVAIHKCCQNSEAFEEICIASRTKSKCDALKEKLEGTTKTKIQTAQVDANNVDELIALIEKFNPDVVLNLAASRTRRRMAAAENNFCRKWPFRLGSCFSSGILFTSVSCSVPALQAPRRRRR